MSENRTEKCVWTGKIEPDVKEVKLKSIDHFAGPTEKVFYVSSRHEEDLKRYNKFVLQKAKMFLFLVSGLSVLLIGIAISALILRQFESVFLILVGLTTTFIGLAIVRFPISTPETVKMMGIQKAIKLTEWAGWCTVILGLILFLIPIYL